MMRDNQLTAACIFFLLVIGTISPIWAVQIDAALGTKAEYSQPTFKFLRTVFIEYPEGGKLAEALQGEDILVNFKADSSIPGISDLISKINNNLAYELGSTVFVTDLDVTYRAHLVGTGSQTAIDYKIILIPKMTNYVLREATNSNAAIIDAQWRGIAIKEPIIIKSAQLGDVEINIPISFFEKEIPQAYQILKETEGAAVLSKHLIDASVILSHPLSKWHTLFDPTNTISDAVKFGYKGEKIVITSYTAGESSIREGIWKEKIEEAKLNLDKKYIIRSIDPASSANIQIDGYVTHETIDGTEYFGSSTQIPKDAPKRGDFPVGVMYGMAGAGAVVAVVVLFWSDKKLKKVNEERLI